MSKVSPDMRNAFIYQIISNIVADYFSLFFVRRWLQIAGYRPLFALITGPVIGACIVYVVYILRDVVRFSLHTRTFEPIYFVDGTLWWVNAIHDPSSTSRFLIFPAIAVHLWLPLFALSVILMQALNYIRQITNRVQWFLKRGQQHPLRALGYVAASIVFIGTVGARGIH